MSGVHPSRAIVLSWFAVWPYWLGAVALSVCGARAGYVLRATPEPYVQFTTGGSTFRNGIKHADFAVLVGLAVAFCAAWLIFLLVERRIHRHEGDAGLAGMRALIGFATIPLLVWAAGLIIGDSQRLDLAYLAAVATICAIGLLLIPTLRWVPRLHDLRIDEFAGLTLLAIVLGALSALIIPFATNRLLILSNRAPVWTGQLPPLALAFLGGAIAGLGGCWALFGGTDARARLSKVLTIVQLALPWGFLLAIPLPWQMPNGSLEGLPIGRSLAVVLCLVAIAYIHLFRRLVRRTQPERPLAMLSPLSVAGVLLFIKLPTLTPGHSWASDDYHIGEALLPIWTAATQHAIPFWDYVPARGLVNYDGGAVAVLLFGVPTAAAIFATVGFLAIAAHLLILLTLGRVIGLLPTAIAALAMPLPNTAADIDYVNTAALATLILAYGGLGSVSWLVLWSTIGAVIFLWAPAQGATVVLATVPLALWQLGRAFRQERWRLRTTILIALPLVVLILVVTPVGRMLLGAARYAAEHAAVAGPAHGMEWSMSTNVHGPVNRWLWEGVRTSWMIVPLSGLLLLAQALRSPVNTRRRELLLIGVPIILIGLLFIYRAAGRIDQNSVSRLGQTSVWMFALCLPLLLYAAWGHVRWPAILAFTVAGAGLLLPALGPIDLRAAARRGLDLPRPLAGGPEAMRAADLPSFGLMPLDARHLADVQQIKRVLDILLDPDETFLGLTERNALHFYLDRRLPVESGALYNLPNDKQQLRAIARLGSAAVPAALGPAEPEGVFDGGPPSLRTHIVYRYLVWRYVPVRINDRIYLVTPDRLARLTAHPELRVETDAAALLDRVFRQEDLAGLPAAWGSSWETLSNQAVRVRALPSSDDRPLLDQVELRGSNHYRATGPTPAVGWEVSAPFPGRTAGLLVFEFACTSGAEQVPLEVSWAAPGEPFDTANRVKLTSADVLVVPLDAAPRWLLAPAIGRLQIRLADARSCGEFSIRQSTLWQRRIAEQTDLEK